MTFSHSDFLKLDVQGYELEVLRGASNLLCQTQFVYLETSLIQTNEECPVFFEVINYLSEKGFRLLDFCSQVRRKDGALWQTDLLFISNKSKFIHKQELTRENWG